MKMVVFLLLLHLSFPINMISGEDPGKLIKWGN